MSISIYITISLFSLFIIHSIKNKNEIKIKINFIYYSLIIYLILISLIFNIDIENYIYYITFIILFSIIFTINKQPIKRDDIFIFMLIFIFNIIIMNLENNLVYDDILYFNFESDSYSKPLTLYYSISVIFFAHSIIQTEKKMLTTLYIVIALLSFYLTIMSGGRAEIICLLLVIGYIFRKNTLTIIVTLVTLTFALNLFLDDEIINKLNGLNRLINTFDFTNNSVLSMRDTLILIFLNNIDINCIIFGCGINSFQLYNNLDIGFYPHNIILEIIHTIGLIGLFLFILLFYKAVKKINKIEKSLLFLITLISLLSGQLITNFLIFYLLNTSDKSSNL